MKLPPPIIPKEHGAWAMLFVPMIIVVLVTRTITMNVVLIMLSTFFVFCSYVPLHFVLRRINVPSQQKEKMRQAKTWTAIYLFLGVAVSIPLFVQGYYLLIVVGCIGAGSFFLNYILTRKNPRTIPGDLLSVIGITLTAPATYYIITKTIDRSGLFVWIIILLFFGGTVFYVHTKIHASAAKKDELKLSEKIQLGKYTIVYYAFALIVVIVISAYHYLPVMMLTAFLPMTIHAIYGTYKLSGKVRFKNLGLLLLAQSLLFGILVGVVK